MCAWAGSDLGNGHHKLIQRRMAGQRLVWKDESGESAAIRPTIGQHDLEQVRGHRHFVRADHLVRDTRLGHSAVLASHRRLCQEERSSYDYGAQAWLGQQATSGATTVLGMGWTPRL